ncbi:MAG: hypothetical protein J6P65_04995 [Bacteroidales bacterium]|nr:hypothetical protein [Bacteroidales bacterium]
MKKVLGTIAVVALSALMFTSCGKKCNCTRYEDGKKVAVETYDNGGTKFFSKTACTNYSQTPEKGYTWESQQNAHSSGDMSKLIECTVEIKCK